MADPKKTADSLANAFNQAEAAKAAPADDVADPDPKKAKANAEDSQRSGYDPKGWLKNLKSGLGLDK